MKTILVKTNLKCNGCIAAVKPALDAIEGLNSWEVDLSSPDRTLSAEVDGEAVESEITAALEKSGYKAWS
ncbi:MAG TPA: cation transporter [Lentimicrobium sp.]|nr:cation transporter [Lentimicrobium sp.]